MAFAVSGVFCDKTKKKEGLCNSALKSCFISDDFTITGPGVPSKRKRNPRNNLVHVIQVQTHSEIKVQLHPQAALCKGTRINAMNNVF